MDIYKTIKIHKNVDNNRNDRYIIECNNRFYESTKSVVDLIVLLQKSKSHESAILEYIKSTDGKYTAEEIVNVIKKGIDPLMLENRPKEKTFLFQKEIISADTIRKLSSKLKFLFVKEWMYIVIILSLIFDFYLMLTSVNNISVFNQIDIYGVFIILIFTLFSTFIHEIGHASACEYFGAKHGGIGFGLYFNIPLLYTDVTSAWVLNTKKRLIINIAGVYFQLYILDILLFVYALSGNSLVFYLVLTLNLGFIMTLNPFFKFDGYWILSDLLDVPNLREVSKELFLSVFNREKYSLRLDKRKKFFLCFYYVLVNIIMLYYVFYIIPLLVLSFFDNLESRITLFKICFDNKNLNISDVMSFIFELCLVVLSVIYFLSFFCRLFKKKKSTS